VSTAHLSERARERQRAIEREREREREKEREREIETERERERERESEREREREKRTVLTLLPFWPEVSNHSSTTTLSHVDAFLPECVGGGGGEKFSKVNAPVYLTV
jgi:septal ring factor EnvC (AmiA/AmiB activator)